MCKRIFPLMIVLLLLLPGCGFGQSVDDAGISTLQVLRVMLDAAPEGADDTEMLHTMDEISPYLTLYGLDADLCPDATIARLGGASAFEIAVILLADGSSEQDISDAKDGLKSYLLHRQGDFTGYAPDQAALVEEGLVLSHDRYLTLVISADPAAVADAFAACFDGSVDFTQVDVSPAETLPSGRLAYIDPEIDDMTLYDTSDILAAWESGDRSSLSPKDVDILEAAEMVLEQALTDGMSDHEKELALYTWLTSTVDYDWNHQDPSLEMAPDSGNPYGGLVNHKAICLGFATTFQLLMDMAGLECITVVGAAFNSREDHAWNMVRLEGEWYCVDATWDMGSPPEYFSYFNVTSDWMAMTDHQWDYSAVPEATAENWGQ